MPKLLPDQTFYPSPTMAMGAPVETIAYVALLNPNPAGSDALAVLDVECVQLVFVSLLPAPAYEATLPRRAGPAVVTNLHPRHRAESSPPPSRKGDRSRRGDQKDRLQPSAHLAWWRTV